MWSKIFFSESILKTFFRSCINLPPNQSPNSVEVLIWHLSFLLINFIEIHFLFVGVALRDADIGVGIHLATWLW